MSGADKNGDLVSAIQFNILTALGLRDFHYVLDIDCGWLGAGRLLIPYLLPERYFAIEPEQRLIEEGVRVHLGHDQLTLKKPRFLARSDFRLSAFAIKFDYIVAHSVFSRSAPAQIQTCLHEAAICLRRDGLLLVSWSLTPEEEGFEHAEANLRKMADQAGLLCSIMDWPHPMDETWAIFHRPGTRVPEPASCLLPRLPVQSLLSLRVIRGAVPGYMESVRYEGESVWFRGWAIHPGTRKPATHVLFANQEGRVLAAAPVKLPRSDVAAVHGDASLYSGFRLRVGSAAFGPNDKLQCYGFTVGDQEVFAFPEFR